MLKEGDGFKTTLLIVAGTNTASPFFAETVCQKSHFVAAKKELVRPLADVTLMLKQP